MRNLIFIVSFFYLSNCSSKRIPQKLFKREGCKPSKDKADGSKLGAGQVQIISIGWKCTSRWILQHVYYKQGIQTNFFDWVFSHPQAVLSTFSIDDPEKVFSVDRASVREGSLSFQDIPTFTSVHDIDPEKDLDEEKIRVVEVYKRRYKRLMDLVKADKQIFFLRWQQDYDPWDPDLVKKFFDHLEKISPKNQHYFISVGIVGDSKSQKSLEDNYRYKFFNLENYPKVKDEPTMGWSFDHYDWSVVFSWIHDHMSKNNP